MDYHDYRDAIFASDLTANAKLVGLVISYHYNWKKQQDAFVSNKTIATESSLSVRTVIRAKKELESRGYLVTKRQYNSANLSQPKCQERQSNNEYNNESNNEKIKESDFQSSSLSNINNVNQEEVVNDFDIIFNMMEGNSFVTRKESAPHPAGNSSVSNKFSGRDDIGNAEVSSFNQELARARGEDW